MRDNGELPIADCRLPIEPIRATDSPLATRHSSLDPWLIWQLVDSAFPTGGFAHSGGLEAAWQHGEVKNRGELVSYVEASLHQLGRASLPFVIATHDDPDQMEEFDKLCDAFTTNHVANRVSRAQGKAFLIAMRRIFAGRAPQLSSVNLPFHHLACVFGGALSLLEVSADITGRLFFFHHLRGTLAAGVRLNIIGPMEAQMLQQQLSPVAEDVLQASASLTLDDIVQSSPLLDIWQGAQDRLYSRLFQS